MKTLDDIVDKLHDKISDSIERSNTVDEEDLEYYMRNLAQAVAINIQIRKYNSIHW